MSDEPRSAQNVTLTLSSTLLKEARHLAVERGMSLSRFLASVLEEQVAADRRTRAARESHLALLREGWDLGTGGQAVWSRDELHERGR